jgi:hypothetical protein
MTIWRRKRYAVSVIALLTCVFAGTGAAIAILGTSVLRPLPLARPDELYHTLPVYDGMADPWAFDDLQRAADLLHGSATFTAMTAGRDEVVTYRSDTATARSIVTAPNFFTLLGISPGTSAYGTMPEAAVISQRLANRLGLSRREAIGRSVRVGDKSLTVSAVIDRNRAFPLDVDVWYAERVPARSWLGIFRVSSTMSKDLFADRISRAFGATQPKRGYYRVSVNPLAASARPAMAGTQRMLIAGIAIFSIIAILNYGLLGIGDARRRAQEFAVRVAVGGTRAQVMRGLFVDQIALVGCALALAAALLIPAVIRVYGASEVRAVALRLPLSLWVAIVLTIALLVVAAILPTRVSASTPEIDVLRRVSARSTPFETWWNRAFVSLQFGVTAFLMVVGTVAVVGVARDKRTNYGFDPANATIGTVSLSRARQGQQQVFLVASEYAAQLRRAFPRNATLWATSLRSMSGGKYRFATDSSDAQQDIFKIPWLSEDVTPNFFDVVGIRIVEGRGFRAADDAGAEPVTILTERSARNAFGSTKVIGRRIRFGENDGVWRTVVGVAADAYPIDPISYNWQARGLRWATGFAYRPLAQTAPEAADADSGSMQNGQFVGGRSGFSMLVRAGNVQNIAATLRALIERVAPGETVRDVGPLDRYLDRTGEVEHLQSTMRLLLVFTICGLALGIIGAMVLFDDVVRSRTNEFGIRRALGAPARNLVLLAGRETIVAGVAGVLVGGMLGARFGPFVAVWLKGTVMGKFMPPIPIDWTFVTGAIVCLLAVLILGTVARAIRAGHLDPVAALRAE